MISLENDMAEFNDLLNSSGDEELETEILSPLGEEDYDDSDSDQEVDEFNTELTSSIDAEIEENHEEEIDEENDDENNIDEDEDDESEDKDDEEDEESEDGGSENEEDEDDGNVENILEAGSNTTKRKKSKSDPAAFSSAMSAILSSHLKAHDRKDPVLVRSRKVVKEIEDSKLESKAKREMRAEKKKVLDKERVKDVLSGIRENEIRDPEQIKKNTEFEKLLKKTAKRGVVKLFNAVIEAQNKAIQDFAVA
ncbi:Rrp15p-domain-containing protein [Dipodascopsis uninucleata]